MGYILVHVFVLLLPKCCAQHATAAAAARRCFANLAIQVSVYRQATSSGLSQVMADAWHDAEPFVITAVVIGALFAFVDFCWAHQYVDDEELGQMPANPFVRGLTAVGRAVMALARTVQEKPSLSTVLSFLAPAIIFICLGALFCALFVYGMMLQIGTSLIFHAVVEQKKLGSNSNAFADKISLILTVAILALFAIPFYAVTSPLMVIGFIGTIGTWGGLGTPDRTDGDAESDVPPLGPPSYDEAVRTAIGVGDESRNPFDKNIADTCRKIKDKATCGEYRNIIPNMILIVINFILLIIWLVLYPIGILIVTTGVLWKLLEAEYGELLECRRISERPATMLSIGALLLALIPVSWPTLPLVILAFMVPGTFTSFHKLVVVSHMKGMIWMLYVELVLMQLPVLIVKHLDAAAGNVDKNLALANFVLLIVASSFYYFVSWQGNTSVPVSIVVTALADIVTGALLILHFIGDASSGLSVYPTRVILGCSIAIQVIIIIFSVIWSSADTVGYDPLSSIKIRLL
jgi:hypothetical protein